MSESYLALARSVLQTESDALSNTCEKLGEELDQAVRLLHQASGPVVFTGIGKSGRISQKLASTFASTGTPSFYIHPSEALHGDFGMVDKGSSLIAISYGGETREVLAVAKFFEKMNSPVVSITGKLDSTLARVSSVALDGSVEREADTLQLAPTSSSTVALALGDALAVCLMDANQFTKQQFAKLHPGGSLGKSLQSVASCMRSTEEAKALDQNASASEVLAFLDCHNFGVACVVDPQTLEIVGAISDGDVRRKLLASGDGFLSLTAEDIMNRSPKQIGREESALKAVQLMEQHKVTSIFVTESQKYVGMVRLHDLIAEDVL